jgi:hypothetical protein
MISSWLTSWYQQQQNEQQLQEPFNDQYETADDWVEVISPSTIMKKRPEEQESMAPVVITTTKKLSRQERRANARFNAKEIKKQARNAAMVISRNRTKASTCLPATPLTTTN